jgi:phytoene desaturase
MSNPQKNAVIIGSGVAGLAAAIRLQLQGYQVQVFEKNDYPGGKLSDFRQAGYHFDAGPSLFTEPEHIEALFDAAGVDIGSYFNYESVEVSCHYFFSNGKQLKAYANPQKLAAEMEAQLGESKQAVLNYLHNAKNLYEKVGGLFLKKSLHRPLEFSWKEVWAGIRAAKPAYLFSSMHQYNHNRFTTPEAVQMFNRYATYNGSNPYKAPAMLTLIPHLELGKGTFYPKGGMISITKSLHRLGLHLGVIFHFNKAVTYISTRHQKVTGVILQDGSEVNADVVVSNQDVYFTYKNLLQQPEKAKALLKQERSSSALIFYWGIRRQFEQLGLHNIFFSADYQREFDYIFNKSTVAADPTVYINITSKMEAGLAPEGCENWFVMVNVPANSGQDWDSLKQQVRAAVLQKLRRQLGADIEPLIATEATLDPITIESRTQSFMGSLYGTSSNSKFAAFLRHPNFSRQYRGLYFVGGSVHPGGGIPLCMRSAAIVSQLVQQDYC